jgi:hypothetical protein
MPWCLHSEVSGAVSVPKRFEPPIEARLQALIVMGDDLSPEEIAAIPAEIYIGRPNAKVLADVIGWSIGPYLFSPRLRALIESLDPGVHRFKPVAVRTEGAFFGRREHGDYHLLITPQSTIAVSCAPIGSAHPLPPLGGRGQGEGGSAGRSDYAQADRLDAKQHRAQRRPLTLALSPSRGRGDPSRLIRNTATPSRTEVRTLSLREEGEGRVRVECRPLRKRTSGPTGRET